jgi:hypothetical protein
VDAAAYEIPAEPTVFFLYNPFRPPVMRQVVGNIRASLDRKPRPTVVIYYNPLSAHVIDELGFLPHKREVRLRYDVTREIQRRVVVYRN